MKRAQIAMEYIFVHGFALLILMGVLAALVYGQVRAQEDTAATLIEEYADTLQSEILLASTVREGYSRRIMVPSQLSDIQIQVSVGTRTLAVSSDEYTAIRSIPNLQGQFDTGENILTNTGGLRVQ